MRKPTLTTVLIAALALAAGAAFAQDFDPIRDADHIGYPDDATTFFGRYDPLSRGPHSDAEWDARGGLDGLTVALVAPTFGAIADADFLDTTGYDPAGAGAQAYAVCAAACTMACGADCADHCGTSCGGR